MIKVIPGLPTNVIGFEASGTVTAEDYETVLIPAVEQEFRTRGKVRFLYHIGAQCDGFEPGAVWDDTRLGMTHITDWERMAVVTDIEWIRAALRIFGLALPGHVRVFSNSEMDQAVAWASE